MAEHHVREVLRRSRQRRPLPRLILVAICLDMDKDNYASPSLTAIAARAGCTRKSAHQWVMRLAADGELVVNKVGRSLLYSLPFDMDRTTQGDTIPVLVNHATQSNTIESNRTTQGNTMPDPRPAPKRATQSNTISANHATQGNTVRADSAPTTTNIYTNNSSGGSGGKRAMPQASSVAIPQALQSPEFREVWALWESYRKEIGKGLKDTTRRLQLDKLARYPQDIAIAALRQSMENGWVGFFPDKLVAQPAGHKQAPRASQRPTYEAKREGKVL